MASVVQAGKEVTSDFFIETKYQRIGHLNEGRLCDTFLDRLLEAFPGERLPKRWKYETSNKFVEQFGKGTKWSDTKSYSGCFLNGEYLFRIWTNAGTRFAWIDVAEYLVPPLRELSLIESIPEGSVYKCRPFVYKMKVRTLNDIEFLVGVIRDIHKGSYGLDN